MNVEGTNKYYSSDQNLFLSELHDEMTKIIPINSDRIEFTNRIQSDPSEKEPHLLIRIKIISTKDSYEPTVKQIISDLDSLIKYKNYNGLANTKSAVYLDETYGIKLKGK